VERTTRKSAAAELLSHRIGAVFRAIVTGVKKDGTYVRLLSPPAEDASFAARKGWTSASRCG
jgi:exoribonuclease R